MSDAPPTGPVLRVEDLRVRFDMPTGVVEAVRGVSVELRAGRTLALVGESGSGKSVSAFSILRLLPGNAAYEGSVELAPPAGSGGTPVDVLALPPKDPRLFALRGGGAGMIFQEPMTALSPVHRVGEQVAEALRIHRGMSRREAWGGAVKMLDRVGIPGARERAKAYPFAFSGGMRQRVVIAMALVCRPRVLIADEPTTALDVTVQARILELLRELREETGAAVLFITHDLGVVAQVADDVAVMCGGRVVEVAPVDDLYRRPLHPYTRRLLAAVPGVPAPETGPDAWAEAAPAGRAVFTREGEHAPELADIGGGRRLLLAHPADRGPEAAGNAVVRGVAPASLAAPIPPPRDAPPLLEVRGLTKRFPARRPGGGGLGAAWGRLRADGPLALLRPEKPTFAAVDRVDLSLTRGQTLGLVGESGSGKTTAARCILRALTPTAGRVAFFDPAAGGDAPPVDLAALSSRELKPLRTRLQMIFQDPMASLNPRMTVGEIIGEPLVIHRVGTRADRRRAVAAMLDRVGLPAAAASRHPHAFSGGQRQRVGIARALILRPALVVCDEATSALDVSVRGQVLALLRELQQELGLTYLFVAHDLELVRSFCDSVAVMRRGRVVERGPRRRRAHPPAAPVHAELALRRSRPRSPRADAAGGA